MIERRESERVCMGLHRNSVAPLPDASICVCVAALPCYRCKRR